VFEPTFLFDSAAGGMSNPLPSERVRNRMLLSGILSAIGFLLILAGSQTSVIGLTVLGICAVVAGFAVGLPILRDGIRGSS
jgi:hypothetical protein